MIKLFVLLLLSMFYIGCYENDQGYEFIQKKYPDTFIYQSYKMFLIFKPCGEVLKIKLKDHGNPFNNELEIVSKIKLKSCDKAVK